MVRSSIATTRMRAALACMLALILAVSMGHSHAGLAFADQHHTVSAADAHGHPGHEHGLAPDCTACPSSACSFLITSPTNVASSADYNDVVFFVASQLLHSADRDGPMRPPNGVVERA